MTAAVRHQLFVDLQFEFQGETAIILPRSRGGITGSRIAGLLQRIPVEHTLLETHSSLQQCGLRCGPALLCAASYVDNIYFPGRHGSSAIANASRVEAVWRSRWNLVIKPDSKQLIVSREHCDDDVIPEDWIVENASVVLGRVLSSDNCIRASWDGAKQKMWKSLNANLRLKHWTKLGAARRLVILSRAIRPILYFHCSAWPPQTQVALEVNRLQRQMTSRAIGCFRDPLESYERYRRRIGRDCSEAINGSWWSKHWFDTACAWREHLDRDWERQRLHYSAGVSTSRLST